MEQIIVQSFEKLKGQFINFFSGSHKTIEMAEKFSLQAMAEATTEIMVAYYEQIDKQIRENKKERKEKQLVIERRDDKREVLTALGTISVKRTYYKKCSGYTYPLDTIMGLDAYQRISHITAEELVNTAIHESFERTSYLVTNHAISKQTVMNKIRNAHPCEIKYPEVKKVVPVLHIDADEDHVHLQNGKNAIVPLVTIYEGVDRSTSRHVCINKFQISEYGLSPDALWEKVYRSIDERYDLENTTIYLHGDGAAWIKQGLEWFEDAKHVLDPYHKNKAIKQATAGMPIQDGRYYQNEISTCLKNCDKARLAQICTEMCNQYQNLSKNILHQMKYLSHNLNAIFIRYQDEEAQNGGATEPHISHGLSSRLSTRPRGWSAKTLKRFVPIIAAKQAYLSKDETKEEPNNPHLKMLGLIDPDRVVSIAGSLSGKSSGALYNVFKPIWG